MIQREGRPINPPDQPASAPPSARRRSRSFLLRLGFGVVSLVILFALLNPMEIVNDLGQANGRYVAAGFGVCLLGLACRTYKWKRILKRMDIHVSFWRLFEVYTISYWFSTFLPGSLGGDVYKIYDVARATDKKIRPALAVVIERLTGVLSLLTVTTIALLVYGRDLPLPAWLMPLLIGGAVAATVALLSGLLFFEPIWKSVNRIIPWTAGLIQAEKVGQFGEVSRELRGNRRLFIEAVALGIGVQLLVLLAYYLMARAVSPGVSVHFFFTLYPLVEIASMIPISINGMGVREGLTVYAMQVYAVSPSLAMSMGILFRLVALALGLLGGILLLMRRSGGWKVAGGQPAV